MRDAMLILSSWASRVGLGLGYIRYGRLWDISGRQRARSFPGHHFQVEGMKARRIMEGRRQDINDIFRHGWGRASNGIYLASSCTNIPLALVWHFS
jgi:hypothetical protein